MATADTLPDAKVLVVWKQDTIDLDLSSSNPDSDLSNGITAAPAGFSSGTLVEMLPGGNLAPGLGMIGQRAQTSLQVQPKRQRGQMSGGGSFRSGGFSGTAELTGTQAPNGGRLAHMVKAAWGAPLTVAARVAVVSGASSTQFNVSPGHGILKGMLISMNWNSVTGGKYHETRQVTAVSGDTITVNRALAGTPTANEFVHPLATYIPARHPTGHDLLYVVEAAVNTSPLEGMRTDYEGCGTGMQLVYDEVAGELYYDWTLMANQWLERTAGGIDLSSAIYTDDSPILRLSRLFLGGTEYEAATCKVDPRITVAAARATSGREGRGRWTHRSNPEGPVLTVNVPYDSAWLTGWRGRTLYGVELHLGANSNGDVAGTDHSYFAAFMPAAQVVAVDPNVVEAGMRYCGLTLEGVRSETSGQNDMEPLALGIAGRTT